METLRTVTISEAARLLGISRDTARRWIASGKLRTVQPGSYRRIRVSDIEVMLEAARV